MTTSSLILMGKFGNPHGLRGGIRLLSYTANPLDIASYPFLTDSQREQRFEIDSIRSAQDHVVIVRLKGITRREQAEALYNLEVFVDRSLLPEPEEEEYYHADLLGMCVKTQEGRRLGQVLNIFNHGAGDILEIALDPDFAGKHKSILVPFTRDFVPHLDVKARTLKVIDACLDMTL